MLATYQTSLLDLIDKREHQETGRAIPLARREVPGRVLEEPLRIRPKLDQQVVDREISRVPDSHDAERWNRDGYTIRVVCHFRLKWISRQHRQEVVGSHEQHLLLAMVPRDQRYLVLMEDSGHHIGQAGLRGREVDGWD